MPHPLWTLSTSSHLLLEEYYLRLLYQIQYGGVGGMENFISLYTYLHGNLCHVIFIANYSAGMHMYNVHVSVCFTIPSEQLLLSVLHVWHVCKLCYKGNSLHQSSYGNPLRTSYLRYCTYVHVYTGTTCVYKKICEWHTLMCWLIQVMSCLDDTNQSTRLVSCKVLQLLLSENQYWTGSAHAQYVQTQWHCTWSTSSSLVDMLHPLYSDLLKRLDDSSDEIRIAITKTITAYIRSASVSTYVPPHLWHM